MSRLSHAVRVIAAVTSVAATSISLAFDPVSIRFIHAVPGGEPVHVNIGDNVIFTNVGPGTTTPYKTINEELNDDKKVVLTTVAGGRKTVGEEIALDNDGELYTIMAVPGRGGAGMSIKTYTVDKESAPSGSQGRVQYVNALPGDSASDLYVDDKKVGSSARSAEIGKPAEISPGEHRVSVKDGNGRQIGSPVVLVVEPVATYTILAVGPAGNEKVTAFNDKAGAQSGNSGAQSNAAGAAPSAATDPSSTGTAHASDRTTTVLVLTDPAAPSQGDHTTTTLIAVDPAQGLQQTTSSSAQRP